MASNIAKLMYSIKTRGVSGTLRWIKYGILSYNVFHVYYLGLNKQQTGNLTTVQGLDLRLGSVDELKQLRSGRVDLPVEFYCDETLGFSTPFFAFLNGELAAIHWLVIPNEYSRFLNLSEGDVELNYNTVLPSFRGKRIAQLLMAFAVDWSQRAGHKRIFGVVNAENIAQFKQMLDMGFRPVEVLIHYAFSRPKATLQFIPKQ